MKYKPGDKVIVASEDILKLYDWKLHANFFCINRPMLNYCNKIVTIDRYYSDDDDLYHYFIKEDDNNNYWRDEFFYGLYCKQLEFTF